MKTEINAFNKLHNKNLRSSKTEVLMLFYGILFCMKKRQVNAI